MMKKGHSRPRLQSLCSRLFLLIGILALGPAGGIIRVSAQSTEDRVFETSDPAGTTVRSATILRSPYAGKIEPRIGTEVESVDDKLRLNIGGSVPLMSIEGNRIQLGSDFFTWTRLRSVGRFKFPVEAVDYYFGIYGQTAFPMPFQDQIGPALGAFRLRLAHISAHLVDGEPGLAGSGRKPMTFSREFVDLNYSMSWYHDTADFNAAPFNIQPYVGFNWLFHTIPDSLGRLSPYIGVDAGWQPLENAPLTFRAGYELRLNNELEPIGENLVRLGLKLAKFDKNGISLEGAYYSGRSPYGQFYDRREKYFSFGFSVGQ